MRTIIFAVSVLIASSTLPAKASGPQFGPNNPFFAPSTLPFQAPPFDKIKDDDYQPAMEAGMAQQLQEIQAIAANPAPPTFDNTLVPLEKSGQLLQRVSEAFYGVVGANSNPTLISVRSIEAPKLAAHHDAIFLDGKLFARVAAVYEQRNSLHLDPEQLRLVEWTYKEFVRAGANLSEAEKTELKKMNEQLAALGDDFDNKLLAATKNGAYVTTDKASLAGLNDAQMKAAAEAATARKANGFVIPLQNTTQQPDLALLSNRSTRETIFENSWNRAEHGDANDTRETIAKMAHSRAQKAKLLGYPNYAAWTIEDQMAKTPEAATKFMDALMPPRPPRAAREAQDIQALIDKQNGGFKLAALGLGVLLRAGAQGEVRSGRRAGQAIFRARQRAAERRLLRGQPALRHHLQGAARHSGVAAGRARVRSLRRRRQAAGACSIATTSSATTSRAAPG